MPKTYSEADMGRMPELPSTLGLKNSPKLLAKKRKTSKFNRNKLKGAFNKLYR